MEGSNQHNPSTQATRATEELPEPRVPFNKDIKAVGEDMRAVQAKARAEARKVKQTLKEIRNDPTPIARRRKSCTTPNPW